MIHETLQHVTLSMNGDIMGKNPLLPIHFYHTHTHTHSRSYLSEQSTSMTHSYQSLNDQRNRTHQQIH